MPATFDLTGDNRIPQGASYSYGLTIKDGSGAALNLTGCTIASQIRRASGTTLLAAFTATITSTSLGTVALSLSPSQTLALPATPSDTYWQHDVLLTRADGSKIMLLEGSVEVDSLITQ